MLKKFYRCSKRCIEARNYFTLIFMHNKPTQHKSLKNSTLHMAKKNNTFFLHRFSPYGVRLLFK